MINKINRLTKEKEIEAVYKQGRSFFTKNLGIKSLPNKLNQKRFVIIVSTKVSKLATERNRIKRIIKSCLIKKIEQINNGQDYMIILRPGQKEYSRAGLEKSLLDSLKRLGCIKLNNK